MKELYINPSMEIVHFSPVDAISTSMSPTKETAQETTQEWIPRENEGAPCSWWDY